MQRKPKMKENFDKWFEGELRQLEGGIANLDGDAGGYTAFGVARNFWPNWSGWPIVDSAVSTQIKKGGNVKSKSFEDTLFLSLTPHLKDFYYKNFWFPTRLDEIPTGIDTYMMSAVIHNGILKPTKILQEAAGCVADGNIGSKTLLAVHKADKKVLLKSLHEGLKNKYSSSKSVYKQAFLNRAEKAYNFASKLQ